MFKRKNLKWTVLAALVGIALAGGVFLAVNGVLFAQAGPAPMEVSALISAMQARADKLSGLSGLLGTEMTLPELGAWRGVPFLYKGPESYVRKDGSFITSPEQTPVATENTWEIFKAGYIYLRESPRHERGLTVMGRSGDTFETRSFGTDTDALLMVNLMPKSWFDPFMEDLKAGPVEQLEGKGYFTIVDVKPQVFGTSRLARHFELLHFRAPRKYYVNAETYVCERLVWGVEGKAEPFDPPVMDIVASDVQTIGGAALPLTYTLRTFAGPSPCFALETKVLNAAVMAASAITDGEFDAKGLSPGPMAVVMRPPGNLETLEQMASKQEMDPGAWLSLAATYAVAHDLKRAKQTLDKAEELFKGKVPDEFEYERAWIYSTFEKKYVAMQLQELPQFERIYADRAARFRARGDDVHANGMALKAAEYRQQKEAAVARAKELKMAVSVQ